MSKDTFFISEKQMKHKTKTMEVLAPAGSAQALAAAVNAGADAVYCGGHRFGARAYADNFTEEELLSGIDYAHLKGARVYLTVNTCLKNREIAELYDYLLPYYRAGLDAVLVQDFGVLSFLRANFPDLPVHASTQMNLTSAYGAELMRSLGLKRVVLARELSLTEIAAIHQATPIELECFVHGALCYSYSGQCLMSSMLGGRSGNRGRCAGTCRLPYQQPPSERANYPLSLKDLCAASLLPALQEAGVCSLKIEGRMKSPSYTAGVTKIYRELVDLLETAGADQYRVSSSHMETLLALGNRSGFTKGFYEVRNDPEMVTKDSPDHHKDPKKTGSNADPVKQETEEYDFTRQKLLISGEAVFLPGEPMRLLVRRGGTVLSVSGAVCEKAKNKATKEQELREKLSATGTSDFAFETLTLTAGNDVFVPLSALKELRRNALAQLKDALLCDCRREPPKAAEKPQAREKAVRDRVDQMAHQRTEPAVAALVSLRSQLAPVLASDRVTTVILDTLLYEKEWFLTALGEDVARCHEKGKQAVYAMPYVIRRDNALLYEGMRSDFCALPLDGILVRDYDGLALLRSVSYPPEKIRLDAALYTYSDQAAESFAALGYLHQTLPVELNEKELLHRTAVHASWIVYGRLPLMVSANCIHRNKKGCDRAKATEQLIDRRKKVFPVLCDCANCTNLILNADILDLTGEKETIRKLAPEELRYQFTTETAEETAAVLRSDAFRQDQTKAFTRGHFKRGVE